VLNCCCSGLPDVEMCELADDGVPLAPHTAVEEAISRGRWLLGLLILQSTSSFVLDSYQVHSAATPQRRHGHVCSRWGAVMFGCCSRAVCPLLVECFVICPLLGCLRAALCLLAPFPFPYLTAHTHAALPTPPSCHPSTCHVVRPQDLLRDHLVVTLFLTMLVGAGGNAGNQSSIQASELIRAGQGKPGTQPLRGQPSLQQLSNVFQFYLILACL
jgi:hypothetical protein